MTSERGDALLRGCVVFSVRIACTFQSETYLFGWVFGGDIVTFVHLQVGDGASKDIPTDSEVAFTDLADLTKVRRGFSMLRLVGKCAWIHVYWNFMFSGRPAGRIGRVRQISREILVAVVMCGSAY